jgi:hypothetical protein
VRPVLLLRLLRHCMACCTAPGQPGRAAAGESRRRGEPPPPPWGVPPCRQCLLRHCMALPRSSAPGHSRLRWWYSKAGGLHDAPPLPLVYRKRSPAVRNNRVCAAEPELFVISRFTGKFPPALGRVLQSVLHQRLPHCSGGIFCHHHSTVASLCASLTIKPHSSTDQPTLRG